jgi:tRNA modification GTPase
MNHSRESSNTFVTRLTSLAPAAIAVIELRGPQAVSWTMACWEPATPIPISMNAIRFGRWRGVNYRVVSDTTGPASEDIVVCQTDEQVVELHCHGGRLAAERILGDLVALGAIRGSFSPSDASPVSPSDDKMDVPAFSQDAWEDLLQATTMLTTAILLHQAHGALEKAVMEIDDALSRSDYKEACRQIDNLCSRYPYGLHLTLPWKLTITGPPNSGKSSLLNAILGFDRAIVDRIAGTTRDVLNERTSLLGWPFEILDTAGLRETQDSIEAEGIRRAKLAIQESDIALCLVDPLVGWTDLHEELKDQFENKLLIVQSKGDLVREGRCSNPIIDSISVSAKTKEGLVELYEAIIQQLIPETIDGGTAVPFRPAHLAYLERLGNRIGMNATANESQ